MKLKIGDRVRFLNDVGGGVVTRIIDKRTIAVENEDGFEVPVLETEVLLVDNRGDSNLVSSLPPESDSGFKPELKKGDKETFKENFHSENSSIVSQTHFLDQSEGVDELGDLLGLYFAFLPENNSSPADSNQYLYLINDSSYRVFYVISEWDSLESLKPLKAGIITPDTKEEITYFAKEKLNTDLALNIQTVFFKNTSFKPQQPDFFNISIHASKFYKRGSYIENDFFDEVAMLITIADTKKQELVKSLTSSAINKSIESKDAPKIKPTKATIANEIVEIDLHIHELVDNTSNLTPTEILDIQMARFKISLETAIKTKSSKIVFIHGVGNGKLKYELRKELEKSYPKFRYQDASFREYGYGATMVYLK